jgi:hypothetical protein
VLGVGWVQPKRQRVGEVVRLEDIIARCHAADGL